jgi:hypothetical protein
MPALILKHRPGRIRNPRATKKTIITVRNDMHRCQLSTAESSRDPYLGPETAVLRHGLEPTSLRLTASWDANFNNFAARMTTHGAA